jgi:hypothetical protein
VLAWVLARQQSSKQPVETGNQSIEITKPAAAAASADVHHHLKSSSRVSNLIQHEATNKPIDSGDGVHQPKPSSRVSHTGGSHDMAGKPSSRLSATSQHDVAVKPTSADAQHHQPKASSRVSNVSHHSGSTLVGPTKSATSTRSRQNLAGAASVDKPAHTSSSEKQHQNVQSADVTAQKTARTENDDQEPPQWNLIKSGSEVSAENASTTKK